MHIIANPVAGRGAGWKSLLQLEELLRSARTDFEVFKTDRPAHATEVAAQLVARGCRRIVVVGGDGTIAEVVNGVVESCVELGLISVGTGNDLARSLGLPLNDVAASYEVLLSGVVRRIDVGCASGRRFVSVLGVGFPAAVAEHSNRLQWLRGSTAFLVGACRAMPGMKAVPMEIILDDQTLKLDCTAVLVQNTPYTGGGLKVVPRARMVDGLFDVVVIGRVGKLNLMWNLPSVYRGRHEGHPSFQVYRSRRVGVSCPGPTLQTVLDGEVVGTTPVEARVLPRSLRVVVPA